MWRQEGYYWIRVNGGEAQVAQWVGDLWWLTGSEVPVREGDVEVVSELLRPED